MTRDEIARLINPEAMAIWEGLIATPPTDSDDPRLFEPGPQAAVAALAKADQIIALLPAGGGSGWRPIADVPLKQDVLVCWGADDGEYDDTPFTVRFNTRDTYWNLCTSNLNKRESGTSWPTHFMDLPPPPAAGEGK